MTKNRVQKRSHLLYYLRVYDREDNRLLGHLVDITTEGLMLLSEAPLETGRSYSLRMEWPMESGEKGEILLEAESLWSRNDVNNDFYDTGFRLIASAPEQTRQIKRIILELGLND